MNPRQTHPTAPSTWNSLRAAAVTPVGAILIATGLTGCSLFASLEGESDTSTVPVPDTLPITTDTSVPPTGGFQSAESHLAEANVSPLNVVPILTPEAVPLDPEQEEEPSLAGAWGSGRATTVKVPVSPTKPDPVVPRNVPPGNLTDLLSLTDYLKKVFAIQQPKEANRFRSAIQVAASSPGTPKDAAYQIYRLNLMEFMAGAERSYWRLFFASRRSAAMKQSINTLAEINDKARIGVLKKTRQVSDITATETLKGHRKIAAAEAEVTRMAARSELVSYISTGTANSSSRKDIETETPPLPKEPAGISALIEKARKHNPWYLGERMRLNDLTEAEMKSAMATLDSQLERRIREAFNDLKKAYQQAESAGINAETFQVGIESNLRNFVEGKINLEAMTTFERGAMKSQQDFIDALWDYQNALIDLDLEVGDYLKSHGQEILLPDLTSD